MQNILNIPVQTCTEKGGLKVNAGNRRTWMYWLAPKKISAVAMVMVIIEEVQILPHGGR